MRSFAALNCDHKCRLSKCIPLQACHRPPAVSTSQAVVDCAAQRLSVTVGDQQATPLLDAVLHRGDSQETPLHVPGHKRGRVLDPSMQRLLTPPQQPGTADNAHSAANPLRYDLTELAGLDFLSSPTSVIKAAQDLAAAAFHAQHTWFLVNGCSVGIHAAVMATVRPGQALLLARNCHLSAFSACVLADAIPVWLQPEQDAAHGIAHCVTSEELQQGFKTAKQRGLKVGAVLVVSPTYYGAVAHVAELAKACHAEGVPLLVDEAHGGHLAPAAADCDCAGAGTATTGPCSPRQPIPASALSQGADLVMHSTHKVLTAMTQAAMLHLNHGALVSPARVSKALQVLQTSSPSYILLSSLDAARRHAFTPGVWQESLGAAQAAHALLQQIPGLELLQQSGCSALQSVAGFDPLRLVVNVQGLGLSGFDAATWLERQHGVVSELATNKLVVFVFGPGSTHADAAALVSACQDLSAAHRERCAGQLATKQAAGSACDTAGVRGSSSSGTGGSSSGSRSSMGLYDECSGSGSSSRSYCADQLQPALTPRQAFFADTEAVPLQAAAGRVSAELLCPYPPGVPVVFPGECLTQQAVQVLLDTLASGGVVTGGHDSTLQSVLVAKLEESCC